MSAVFYLFDYASQRYWKNIQIIFFFISKFQHNSSVVSEGTRADTFPSILLKVVGYNLADLRMTDLTFGAKRKELNTTTSNSVLLAIIKTYFYE